VYQITKLYWLSSDEDNWIVGRKYLEPKRQKVRLKDCRYFNRLDSALRFVLDQDLKNCKSIAELLQSVEEVKDGVSKWLDLSTQHSLNQVKMKSVHNKTIKRHQTKSDIKSPPKKQPEDVQPNSPSETQLNF